MRFRLRTLLVVVLLNCLVLAWLGDPLYRRWIRSHYVSVHGQVESPNPLEIRCTVRSRAGYGPSTSIIDVVPDGMFAKQGDSLITFDSKELENERRDQEILVNVSLMRVAQMQAAYDAAASLGIAALEAASAELENSKARCKEAESKLAEIDQQLRACVVTAPRAGQVVYANLSSPRGERSEFEVKPGARVRERQIVMRLCDPSSMHLRARISEEDARTVKPGNIAWLRFDRLNRTMEGQVTRVVQRMWWGWNPHSYSDVIIRIVDPSPEVRFGDAAHVLICRSNARTG